MQILPIPCIFFHDLYFQVVWPSHVLASQPDWLAGWLTGEREGNSNFSIQSESQRGSWWPARAVSWSSDQSYAKTPQPLPSHWDTLKLSHLRLFEKGEFHLNLWIAFLPLAVKTFGGGEGEEESEAETCHAAEINWDIIIVAKKEVWENKQTNMKLFATFGATWPFSSCGKCANLGNTDPSRNPDAAIDGTVQKKSWWLLYMICAVHIVYPEIVVPDTSLYSFICKR